MKVIPKKNYCPDRLTIAATSQVIKKGGCVTFAPEGLASNDGSNKHVEIKLNYYSINKDITKEDFINEYMNDWDNLNLGIPVE